MPEGVIVGGWNFVVAAYVLVVAGLALYAVHLVTKLRSTRRQIDREQGASATRRPATRSET